MCSHLPCISTTCSRPSTILTPRSMSAQLVPVPRSTRRLQLVPLSLNTDVHCSACWLQGWLTRWVKCIIIIFVCLSLCLCICLCVCLYVCLSVCAKIGRLNVIRYFTDVSTETVSRQLFVSLSVYISPCLSVCLPVFLYVSVCMCLCLSVCAKISRLNVVRYFTEVSTETVSRQLFVDSERLISIIDGQWTKACALATTNLL